MRVNEKLRNKGIAIGGQLFKGKTTENQMEIFSGYYRNILPIVFLMIIDILKIKNLIKNLSVSILFSLLLGILRVV